jgi:hypothetical protein
MQPRLCAPENDFDHMLVAELEKLRTGEQNLRRLFPKLRSQPQLRDCFLLQLSEIRQRADRLNAVLDPLGAFAPPLFNSASPTILPAA